MASSLTQNTILDLFLTVAARPHSRCIYKLRYFRQQQQRSASTSLPTAKFAEPTLRDAARSADPSRPRDENAKIPLHVGLDRNPDNLSAISKLPIPKGEKGENFIPSVLARPLGLTFPPTPGQNRPYDVRSWRERQADFTDKEKALERRRIYLRSFLRPYFQEWRRVDHWKGKTFVSNDRLFRRDKALYFPNIWGQTLGYTDDGANAGSDTTSVFLGKITVVGIQSGHWAEEQVNTFVGKQENPQLEQIISENGDLVHRADINIQGDWIRMLLVKLFRNRLRRTIPEDRWSRYFLVKLPRDVRKGLTEDVRDAMGLLNSQVGYVYLLDSDCRIRWAGSGHAWKGEVPGLNGAIKRLVQEERNLHTNRAVPKPGPYEARTVNIGSSPHKQTGGVALPAAA